MSSFMMDAYLFIRIQKRGHHSLQFYRLEQDNVEYNSKCVRLKKECQTRHAHDALRVNLWLIFIFGWTILIRYYCFTMPVFHLGQKYHKISLKSVLLASVTSSFCGPRVLANQRNWCLPVQWQYLGKLALVSRNRFKIRSPMNKIIPSVCHVL